MRALRAGNPEAFDRLWNTTLKGCPHPIDGTAQSDTASGSQ